MRKMTNKEVMQRFLGAEFKLSAWELRGLVRETMLIVKMEPELYEKGALHFGLKMEK